jgi:hypothetical protein
VEKNLKRFLEEVTNYGLLTVHSIATKGIMQKKEGMKILFKN